jgi:hypothetical protein
VEQEKDSKMKKKNKRMHTKNFRDATFPKKKTNTFIRNCFYFLFTVVMKV